MATLFIAADHGGFELKEALKLKLNPIDVTIKDLGTDSATPVDYPDFAHALAKQIELDPRSLGILICGTGIGMAIAANRHPGIRAALVTTPFMAQMARRHNNANVLVLGGRVLDAAAALILIETWLKETYEGGRHDQRLRKL